MSRKPNQRNLETQCEKKAFQNKNPQEEQSNAAIKDFITCISKMGLDELEGVQKRLNIKYEAETEKTIGRNENIIKYLKRMKAALTKHLSTLDEIDLSGQSGSSDDSYSGVSSYSGSDKMSESEEDESDSGISTGSGY